MFLKISQCLQEKTCVGVSFLITLQAFFYKTLPVTASAVLKIHKFHRKTSVAEA